MVDSATQRHARCPNKGMQKFGSFGFLSSIQICIQLLSMRKRRRGKHSCHYILSYSSLSSPQTAEKIIYPTAAHIIRKHPAEEKAERGRERWVKNLGLGDTNTIWTVTERLLHPAKLRCRGGECQNREGERRKQEWWSERER